MSMAAEPTVWVDADACPKVIKEILFRAAQRTGVRLVLVANHGLNVPPSPNIERLQVPGALMPLTMKSCAACVSATWW